MNLCIRYFLMGDRYVFLRGRRRRFCNKFPSLVVNSRQSFVPWTLKVSILKYFTLIFNTIHAKTKNHIKSCLITRYGGLVVVLRPTNRLHEDT